MWPQGRSDVAFIDLLSGSGAAWACTSANVQGVKTEVVGLPGKFFERNR